MMKLKKIYESIGSESIKNQIIKALNSKGFYDGQMAMLMQLVDKGKNDKEKRNICSMIDNLASEKLSTWQLQHFPKNFYKWYIEEED